MVLRLVFVRHGLSSFNEKKLIQGRTDDSYLTEKGYEQASKSGEALSRINFNRIYSSPLTRASETAKTIERSLKKDNNIIYDNNLLEVDLSSWSGLTIDEIKKKYPESYLVWKNNPENLSLKRENNETYKPIKELYDQAECFIKKIIDHHLTTDNMNILIVGHNAILRCLILSLIGKPNKGFRKIKLDNASFSIINISKSSASFKTQLECLNQTSHLKKIPDQIGDSRIFLV